MEPSSSPRYSLNKTDLLKILRGALIIALGAFSVEFLDHIRTVLETGTDFGQLDTFRPLAISALASSIEAIRRFLVSYR